ncbi:MAG: TRAP transporter small permease subunit [Bacteroidota bacterium]
MEKITNFLNQINERVGRATAWLTTILMLLVCFNVAARYLFNNSIAWRTELEWHLFALIFLLGAGYALKHDKHVRVDLFYAKFSKKQQALVNFIGTLVFLLPWCSLIIFASYKYAYSSWMINEGSPDNGLPARYLIKSAITIGFVLLFLQAISILLQSVSILLGKQLPPGDTS